MKPSDTQVGKCRGIYRGGMSKEIDAESMIAKVCDSVKGMLISKNRAYGNSFMFPINVFSAASAMEQINVRIDDKLNRIQKGKGRELVPEDTELDLIGYLVLKRVLLEWEYPTDEKG